MVCYKCCIIHCPFLSENKEPVNILCKRLGFKCVLPDFYIFTLVTEAGKLWKKRNLSNLRLNWLNDPNHIKCTRPLRLLRFSCP